MNKNKTNLSVVNNIGVRVKPSIIVGEQGSYSSGDILDANAVEKVVKNKVNDVIGDAADALDTLEELGGAIPTKLSLLLNDVPYVAENDLKVEEGDANGHEYVDLGLPSGTLWATMNVGAASETDYGLYFQWGDTQGYTASQIGSGEGQKAFKWEDYKYGNGTSSPGTAGITKYNSTDGKTALDIEDDAVRVNMGGTWRMPTTTQIRELLNTEYCSMELTTVNDIRGWLFTSKTNENTLFFPNAGSANDILHQKGSLCSIWSSSCPNYNATQSYFMYLSAIGGPNVSLNPRHYGNSIRGVLNIAKVDKYATKQELNAETLRAQTVEATKANTADLATVATTGSYNDLTDKPVIPDALIQADWNQTDSSAKDYIKNKPTIPNVAVVNLEMEDLDMSTNPMTIINQDKISLICDLLDAGTIVFGTTSAAGVATPGICTVMYSGSSYTLYINAFTALIEPSSPLGSWAVFCKADVTSRYVTSNTEP